MAKTRKFAFVRLISSVLFGYNKSIKKITIPSSVRYIFGDAFRGCTGLADDRGFLIVNNTLYGYLGTASEVDIPDGVTRIETGVFDKASFQKVRIPESVTDISCYAFCDCNQLTDISMGGNIERIENGAFLRCVKLKSITIPDSIRHIGEGAFEDCESLSEIKISDIAIENLKDSCIRKGLLNFTLLFKYLCGSFTAENEKMESLIITELNLKKNFTRMTDLLWTHKKCGALAKLFLSYKKITPENIDVLLEKCAFQDAHRLLLRLGSLFLLFQPTHELFL